MKNKTIYGLALLLLSVLFLGSCKNDLPVIKKRVAALDTAKGVVSTIASGKYNYITVDKSGNLYALRVNFGGTDSIFKFDASGNKTLFYTPAPVTDHDTLVTNTLTCLATDSSGNIYTEDYLGISSVNAIKISPAGSASILFTGLTYAGNYSYNKIAVDALGNFYFSDFRGLFKIAAGTSSPMLLIQNGNIFAVDKNGNVFYSKGQIDVEKLSTTGAETVIVAPANITGYIYNMSCDVFGNVYVSSGTDLNAIIQKINVRDSLTTVINAPFGHVDGPVATAKIGIGTSLTTDVSGNLYFTELSDLRKITF